MSSARAESLLERMAVVKAVLVILGPEAKAEASLLLPLLGWLFAVR